MCARFASASIELVRGLLAIAVVAACAHPPPPPPLVAAIGCFHVTVMRVHAPGTVLEWGVSNTCAHAVLVDITGARVVAIAALFARVPLSISGPYPALAPGYVDPGETAFVRVAYASALGDDATIEVELDDFDDDDTHRPVVIPVVPRPPVARPPRTAPWLPVAAGDGRRDSW